MITLADPEGGLRGCNPPLNFHKIVVIRVAVVIYIFSCYFIKQCVFVCVEWCCHWVLLYDRQQIGTAIVHYYFFLPHDKQFVFAIRAKLGLTPKWMLARTPKQVGGAQMVDKVT